MGKLTRPRAADQIRPATIDRFGGIDRRPGAQNGAIFDTKNMHGGDYPCAASRPGMKEVTVPANADVSATTVDNYLYHILIGGDDRYTASLIKTDMTGTETGTMIPGVDPDGNVLSYSWMVREEHGADADKRTFAYVGNYLCVFPDMIVYDTAAETPTRAIRPIKDSASVTVSGSAGQKSVRLLSYPVDGKVYSQGVLYLKRDVITGFHVAPGVLATVSGLKKDSQDYSFTKEVLAVERHYLDDETDEYILIAFEDGTFEDVSVPADGEAVSVELNANTPYLTSAVEVNGRVWGYYKNFIYASALNDPYNWEKSAQLSTDSWNTEAAGEGEITGVFEWNGAPYFMKETGIIRIYGSYAQEFMQQMTKCVGMYAGNERSVALCGGAIYYNSPLGIMRFAGTVPVPVSAEFGSDVFRYSAGGSDGRTYFVSLWNDAAGDDGDLWALDTITGDWHRYAEGRYTRLFFDGRLWGRRAGSISRSIDAALLIISGDTGAIAPERLTPEAAFETTVRFADFTGSYGSYQSRSYYGRKGVSRIDVRATLDSGVTMRIWIAYDAPSVPDEGDARWLKVSESTASGAGKRTVRVPVIVRRCDHFALMITTEPGSAAGATGRWVLHALTVFKYQGTDIH